MRIRTTKLNATDTKGARIRARTFWAGSVRTITVPYDHGARYPHHDAARMLAQKLAESYTAPMVQLVADNKSGRGYVYEVLEL